MPRLRLVSILVALALFGVACGDGETATTTAAAGEATQAGESFTTVSGGQLDLGDLEGQDTVLWFWAPW